MLVLQTHELVLENVELLADLFEIAPLKMIVFLLSNKN